MFLSDDLKEHYLFNQIQQQVKKNRWMQKVQYALMYRVTTSFKRVKLLAVGNGGAGKTSTIRSLLTKRFQADYDSTEVADANVQVSLLSALDWRLQKEKASVHLMDSDFQQAVSQITEDKAVETYTATSEVINVPALNPKVLEAISRADGITDASSYSETSPRFSNRKSKDGIRKESQKQLTQLRTKSSKTPTMDFFCLSTVQDRNSVSFTIWDFGGQEVFYHLHHLFLTRNGVYLVVLNPIRFLKNSEKELESLTFWTDSLSIHAPEAPLAFVATRAGEVSQEDVQQIDNMLADFCSDKQELNIMLNNRENLMFFPVENSLKVKNEKYLVPLKAEIHKVVTNENFSGKVHGLNERIKLSWIYIIDSFVREARSHMLFEIMMSYCKRLGVLSDELEKMLTFYAEVGTIVYFPPKNKERSVLNEVAVLNPQWLLKALACYIYDRKIHKKKRFSTEKPFRELLVRYEDTGILSRSLLQHFWRDYTEEEVAFLESLSSTMLLTSKYVFDAEKVEGATVDAKAYVVPAMLKDYKGEVLDILPDPANSFHAYIKFDGPMPTGIFERFISEIVRKSGQFEGSESPRLYKNYADIGFGSNMVYSALQKTTKTIRISTVKKDGEDHMRRVVTFVSEIVRGLVNNILGEQFKPRILVETDKENEIVVIELGKLWDALQCSKKKIVAVTLKGGKIPVSISSFSAFHPDDSVIFNSSAIASCDKTHSAALEDTISDNGHECCAFLVHEWGNASSGHETHKKVLDIKEMLERRKIILWVHEDFADVDRLEELLIDYQLSRKLVIFLSRRYMERIIDPENDVAKQFPYWMDFFPKENTIIAILEESLLNTDTWYGPITQCNVGDVCNLDFSTTAKTSENFDRLITNLMM